MTAVGRMAIGRNFPRASGVLFGLGLGGFFDGIVFHQLLQWHHMFSSLYPIDSIGNLEFNTFWDGVFHSATYLFFVAGLFVLWRSRRRPHFSWSTKDLIGTGLIGFGLFNLIEGLIDHQLLGIHHVNEKVERSAWLYWDGAFLVWGAVMLAGGYIMVRRKHA
ncbi:DUF2243 domain-containing protein [Rhizobium hidalgonense]|uniref:DUF2243 domain-containing protein n=1 Tax=Rhizobium hidalgonense TaxID=1538159 RepID=A0A2A6K9E2_9HYPH|nr:DUF2243 domain-containing protein [Rhizobium hidalgonense]MDR9775983.1 DUF2243 domain-containing protein [Rhizobium hidalgonense]MDR9814126.1 DUF2243 domain-containing protein [Rhizobium hidalgonense]MDR9820790.1 DUF2243 domain-containing protein [Rhizobium hidalgonense]PDT20985.1 hypothetical protein CO674_25185 [Rhizobium hidalgonense]PON07217.1 hypothetical protein ATY29_12860 [Rhizobium hidalgonense]